MEPDPPEPPASTRRHTSVWREVALVVGLGLVVLGLVFWLRAGDGDGHTTRALSPKDTLAVQTAQGHVSLGTFVGRPTVLVFWATWCGACRDELPELAKLAAEGHQVLAVSRERLAKTTAFVRARALEVPLGCDRAGVAFKAFGIEVLPTTIVFDADGRPIEVQRGWTSYERLRERLAVLAR